jgi:CBS domain-containing protein
VKGFARDQYGRGFLRMSPVKASDAMTTTVITVKPDTTVQEAARLLLTNGISGMPVVDDAATLVGIISEGDLLRRAHEEAWPKAWGPPPRRGWARWLMDTKISEAEYITQHDVRVADIMTREVVQAQPESSLSDVAALMLRHRIKRVPVVRNGRVVGIVSRQDIVKALAGLPKE